MAAALVGIDLGSSGVVAVRRDDDGTVSPVAINVGGPAEDVLRAVRNALGATAAPEDVPRAGAGAEGEASAETGPGAGAGTARAGAAAGADAAGADAAAGAASAPVVVAGGVPVVLADPGGRAEELRAAALAAGWGEVTVVAQAVAAANYLGRVIGSPVPSGRAVAVFDVGARLTVSVVRNEGPGLRVVASGTADAGGDAMDAALAADLPADVPTARRARETLSVSPRTQVGERSLTRAQLETAIRPVLTAGLDELERVLDTAGATPDQLVGLILVGGAARMPMIARVVRDRIGLEPIRSANPERSIAEGLLVSVTPAAPAEEPTVLVPFGGEQPPTTPLPTAPTPTMALPTTPLPTAPTPTAPTPTAALPTTPLPPAVLPTKPAGETRPASGAGAGAGAGGGPGPGPGEGGPWPGGGGPGRGGGHGPDRSLRRWTLIGVAGLLALAVAGGGIGWALAGPGEPLPDPVVTTTSPDVSPSPSDTSPTPYVAVEPLVEESSPSPTPEESSESPSPEPEPVRDFADGFKVYSEEGSGRFVTPSGNIACYLDDEFARCDIRERDWTGEESSSCEQEYGDSLGVKGEESYFICHGDTLDFDSNTLSYGEALEVGDYICTSSDTGVLCANKSTGDGFTMSRSDYELF